jgi:hypothetical protein
LIHALYARCKGTRAGRGAKSEESEEVLPPELKHDVDAAFDRIVAALRAVGAGERVIAEYDGPLRRRALEVVETA